jgi:hypothetical protein
MIITKGQINTVTVSVVENTTLSSPVYYLFEFKRKASNVFTYCIAQIVTNYGTRQSFSIEETNTPVPNTKIKLQAGEYFYKIYQQESSTNIDPANTTIAASGFAYVESGILTVIESVTQSAQYAGANNTNAVYEQ